MTISPTPAGYPRRTGGHLWGHRRVRAKISLNALAAEAGINKGLISLMENGRLIPTSAEFDAISAALERLTEERNDQQDDRPTLAD